MIRVLSIISNNIESGGVESYLINAYKHINLENTKIDLLVPGKVVFKEYEEEFKRLGCRIIQLNINDKGLKRIKALFYSFNKIMKEHEYDVVHVNTGNISIEAIALKCAYKAKIPIRIAHSHGTVFITGKVQEIIRGFLRSRINKYATERLACSTTAANALFGIKYVNDTVIAKNGIDADKYDFDIDIRRSIRKENDWEESFIIGSVGRIAPEKNYGFILEIFEKIYREYPNAKLVLVGDGEEKEPLEKKADLLGIHNNVKFMGVRKDVAKLLQGFDVFVLPSKREALGIVNIEAQATGLPCVVSDVIPREVDLTGLVSFVSLNDDINIWIKTIMKYKEMKTRHSCVDIVKKSGYDFSTSYDVIDELYNKRIK